ncbi:pyridoxal phosphate-dependent transferase [Sporodiniella umbellata]|nr:pyridoxal phosphate-dependent transferase [Sporodiniella umbellata]
MNAFSDNSEKSVTVYDFTSDTSTAPTDEMFEVMKTATRGDDVYQTDSDCKALESYVAELFGHEAALFCTSGTLTNQLGLRALLNQPPHSVLCDSRSHIFNLQCGGAAYHSQATLVPVVAAGYYLTADEVEKNINKDYLCGAPTKVIALENTMNGTIMPIEEIEKIHKVARANDCKMHLDGARIWNASQKTGIALSEYGAYFDTISVCISKGVGAPIGSLLVGSKALIEHARHLRKMFGGGWRQAGSLARVGLYCIENIMPTMPFTHGLTEYLANTLKVMGLRIDLPVETNMVFADPNNLFPLLDWAQQLKEKNILIGLSPKGSVVRIVLHHQITAKAVRDFIKVTADLIRTNRHPNHVSIDGSESVGSFAALSESTKSNRSVDLKEFVDYEQQPIQTPLVA